MIHFFADDNYVSRQSVWVIDVGDEPWKLDVEEEYFVYGGFCVSSRGRKEAEEAFATVKAAHGLPPHLPIKWNFLDPRVKAHYERYGANALHAKALSEMDAIRDEVFGALGGANHIRLIAVVVEKKSSKKSDAEIHEMAFVNLLQRVGAYKRWCVKPTSTPLRMVLDYPSTEVRTLPFELYHEACFKDTDRYGNAYACGALGACGFDLGLLVANTNTNPMLQLADMVVGSITDFVGWALKGGPRKRVDRFFTKLVPLFHRDRRGEIIPYGIALSTQHNDEIEAKLKEAVAGPGPSAPAAAAPAAGQVS